MLHLDAATDKALTDLAASMNQELVAKSSMRIGETIPHPEGYLVKVVSGCFLDPKYGRVSNWWTWQRIQPDGSLGPKESGYGW